MENTVYCLATDEHQANDILTHLRNLRFTSSEISVLLKDDETRNISVKEDAIRGAEKGGIAGIVGALALTILTIPTLGPLAVAGPILATLGGAAVGGAIGGLAGGSGALTRIGIPEPHSARVEEKIRNGAILIAVHSSDPMRREEAVRIFTTAGAEEVVSTGDLAA